MEKKAKKFSDIPPEITLKIFSYFTRKEISKCLAPVCTEWSELSKDTSLWKRLEINVSIEKPDDVYRQVIACCETSLMSLKLYTPTMEKELITYFRNFNLANLKELHLRGWRHIYNSKMCDSVSNVEILSLHVDSGIYGLQHISQLKNLKSLTISGHEQEKVHSYDVELIIEKCTKLEALILRILDSFDDQVLVQLAKYRKRTLKHLEICRGDLTPDGIRALKSCQNISTLCLKGRGGLLSTEILKIMSRIQNLNWLDLGGTVGFGPQTWNIFFMSPNLYSLKILEISYTNIDDKAVVSLALTCRQLVIIDLSRNDLLHDPGVRAVIKYCTQLWFLDVSSTRVTRDILRYIPTQLAQLKYLRVQKCTGIHERDINAFTRRCPRVEIRNKDVEYIVDESLNVKWNRLS